ncbi:MAG: hypothetical protein ACOC4K_01920 [Verrucomicrobiota bacterium]
MAQNASADIEAAIDRFLQVYSAKRIALSAFLVGGISIAASIAIYALSASGIFSALAFGVTSLLLVNVAMIAIVPTTEQLARSKSLLCGVVKHPKRIRSVEKSKVSLVDGGGNACTLNAVEQRLWDDVVVPAIMRQGMSAMAASDRPQRKLTVSERRYVDEQKKLMVEKEKAIKEEQKRIAEEQSRIARERSELERRTEELQEAENLVISRLSEVEMVQAELEQMREDIDSKAATVDGSKNVAETKLLREREAALKAKEAELEQLKEHLTRDQEAVRAQKTDLNQLKGELLRTHEGGSVSEDALAGAGERERALEARLRELEAANRELEERSRFVEETENSLIERLNQLSEREASVEQSEINRGMRAG